MASWLIVAVGIVYVGVAVDLALKDNTPLALTFAGYAFSNIGLYLAARV